MNRNKLPAAVCILLTGVLPAGCDWVDSAGSQGASSTPTTSIFLDDTPVGDAIVINEQSDALILASRDNSAGESLTYTWSTEPSAQGALPACIDQNGFNQELAADSLQQACAAGSDCEVEFVQVTASEDTDADTDADVPSTAAEFRFETPALDASVGLTYTLTVEEANGLSTSSDYTFCLIAINEAPEALDDSFVVEEGSVLNVTADSINLLSNDSDDTDVSNTQFSVLPEALREPEFAAFFELGTDGSFTYQSSLSGLRVDQFDRFDYELTDGVFTTNASVTIRIVASNQPPEQTAVLPVLEATEDEPFSVDLSTVFSDPEDSELMFSLAAATPLATGSGLELDATGVLSGTPTDADVGTNALSIEVSDGSATIMANVFVAVEPAEVVFVPNTAPEFVAGSVFSQTVRVGSAITPIRAEFTDTADDTLTYSIGGTQLLPAGVTLNSITGVISGRPLVNGTFRALRVIATDSLGETARSTPFNLTVTTS